MSDKEEIKAIASYDERELLDYIMEHPVVLTDSYYRDFGRAVQTRYEQLREQRT